MRYQGNIRFRKLIQNRMKEYRDACRHVSKDLVAQDVVDDVLSRGGRFLRRVESETETSDAWVQVDREAAIGKCKQAFRDEKRAAFGVTDIGETHGPDLSERSSDHEESTGADFAANAAAPFIRNQQQQLSFAQGISSVLERARLQQQTQSLNQQYSGLSPLNELTSINPLMLQNAKSQVEIELLLRALQANNHSTLQIQQPSVTAQVEQLLSMASLPTETTTQLQAILSMPGPRQTSTSIDHSLNLLRTAYQNHPTSAYGTVAQADAAGRSGFDKNLPSILNQPSRSAPVAGHDILNMPSPDDGLRLATSLERFQPQQLHGRVPAPFLPPAAVVAAAASTATAVTAPPPRIQEERARLAKDALTRYQAATLGYLLCDPKSPQGRADALLSDGESSSGASLADSAASTDKKPAARLNDDRL